MTQSLVVVGFVFRITLDYFTTAHAQASRLYPHIEIYKLSPLKWMKTKDTVIDNGCILKETLYKVLNKDSICISVLVDFFLYNCLFPVFQWFSVII